MLFRGVFGDGSPFWIIRDLSSHCFVVELSQREHTLLCGCPNGQHGYRCIHAEEVRDELRVLAGERQDCRGVRAQEDALLVWQACGQRVPQLAEPMPNGDRYVTTRLSQCLPSA